LNGLDRASRLASHHSPTRPVAWRPSGLFFVFARRRRGLGEARTPLGTLSADVDPAWQEDGVTTPIVSDVAMPYTNATEHHMTLLSKVFTTKTLVQIIFVLTAIVVMKATSAHYDFSWATVFAAG